MDRKFIESSDLESARKCFLFSGVGDGFIYRVLEDGLCEIVNYKKGSVIYKETDFRRSLGLVIKGTAAVTKNISGGRKYIMTAITSPGLFGAAAMFSSEESYVTRITASSPCRIAFFPQELIEKLIDENRLIAKNYIAFLSGRIQFLNRKVQSLVTASTSQSILKYIAANMKPDGDCCSLDVGSYSSLAQMLNVGRASLYRGLDDFQNRGLIRREGKKIVVIDPQGLITLSVSGAAE